MTVGEAIKILKDGRENLYGALDKSVPYEQQHTLAALDIAIKSLEAWEKVKEEISNPDEMDCFENSNIWQVWFYKIIDKHLEELEVSNESTDNG